MWEVTFTYKGVGPPINICQVIPDKLVGDAAVVASLLRKGWAEAQALVRLQERESTLHKLYAHNCRSWDELEVAKRHWWGEYNKYRDVSRYSGSCISDSEHMREALYRWQDCIARQERIHSGKENF